MYHDNSGACPKCKAIIDRYPGFFEPLRSWFESFQKKCPEAHVSCAGRGHDDQESAFKQEMSRAHYGQSAHNYNIALDFFVIFPGLGIYDKNWFNTVLERNLVPELDWYGSPGSVFYEMPHVEWKSWRDLKAQKLITLVDQLEFDEY
jgi:hypothetical protein